MGEQAKATIQDAWHFILSERETFSTLILLTSLTILAAGAVVGAGDTQGPGELFNLWGWHVDREISLGTVGGAFVIVYQVGRWGRKMLNRVTHIPERVGKLEEVVSGFDVAMQDMRRAIDAVDARCPLRRREEDGCFE